jgi:hypothetical protein
MGSLVQAAEIPQVTLEDAPAPLRAPTMGVAAGGRGF